MSTYFLIIQDKEGYLFSKTPPYGDVCFINTVYLETIESEMQKHNITALHLLWNESSQKIFTYPYVFPSFFHRSQIFLRTLCQGWAVSCPSWLEYYPPKQMFYKGVANATKNRNLWEQKLSSTIKSSSPLIYFAPSSLEGGKIYEVPIGVQHFLFIGISAFKEKPFIWIYENTYRSFLEKVFPKIQSYLGATVSIGMPIETKTEQISLQDLAPGLFLKRSFLSNQFLSVGALKTYYQKKLQNFLFYVLSLLSFLALLQGIYFQYSAFPEIQRVKEKYTSKINNLQRQYREDKRGLEEQESQQLFLSSLKNRQISLADFLTFLSRTHKIFAVQHRRDEHKYRIFGAGVLPYGYEKVLIPTSLLQGGSYRQYKKFWSLDVTYETDNAL